MASISRVHLREPALCFLPSGSLRLPATIGACVAFVRRRAGFILKSCNRSFAAATRPYLAPPSTPLGQARAGTTGTCCRQRGYATDITAIVPSLIYHLVRRGHVSGWRTRAGSCTAPWITYHALLRAFHDHMPRTATFPITLPYLPFRAFICARGSARRERALARTRPGFQFYLPDLALYTARLKHFTINSCRALQCPLYALRGQLRSTARLCPRHGASARAHRTH